MQYHAIPFKEHRQQKIFLMSCYDNFLDEISKSWISGQIFWYFHGKTPKRPIFGLKIFVFQHLYRIKYTVLCIDKTNAKAWKSAFFNTKCVLELGTFSNDCCRASAERVQCSQLRYIALMCIHPYNLQKYGFVPKNPLFNMGPWFLSKGRY